MDVISEDFLIKLGKAKLPSLLGDIIADVCTIIVDIGALPLDEEKHVYDKLIHNYKCKVIGFEPQFERKVVESYGKSELTVYPFALGDGNNAVFHKARYHPTSSLYHPNTSFLKEFVALSEMLHVEEENPIKTHRLDDVYTEECDLLKLDVQGYELRILENAKQLLKNTSIVFVEVEFEELYSEQPRFMDVDQFMQAQGFELGDIKNRGYGAYNPALFPFLKSKLLWADAVYWKRSSEISNFNKPSLLRMFLIAHIVLGNYGLAAKVLKVYDSKGNSELADVYVQHLTKQWEIVNS